MTRTQLFEEIKKKQSYLCVGLDTDLEKIPTHLLNTGDPVFEFNKQIIDATKDFCIAYKPNIAFYECLGVKGWQSLQKTLQYIPANIFTIADAKRGDIGNTSKMYAKTFFEQYNFDSITVAPYMGEDSVTPFLEYKNKWAILLALTSNKGANDFQLSELRTPNSGQKKLFEKVIVTSQTWGSPENLMYVVGATKSELFTEVRSIAPDHFLLVPGIGAQGGDLKEVSKNGMNNMCGLLVNSSRSILYASAGEAFADAARAEAKRTQEEMEQLLNELL